MAASCIFFIKLLYIEILVYMCILYKIYLGHLRLLRSSDVVKNLGPMASRRSCRIVYAIIRVLHEKLSDLPLTARGGDVFFFVLRILSLPSATFPSS